jgi:hypothetical protein
VAVLAVRGESTVARSQQIRYPQPSNNARYIFSIWAFPEESYIDSLRAYFRFSHEYYQRTGYRIKEDQSSLFSYSFHGPVMTFDPVSTGNPGWNEFLIAYNELCSELGGTPLFNQTNLLTRAQVEKAFGDRLQTFDRYRRRFDPTDRLLNPFFKELLAQPSPAADAR